MKRHSDKLSLCQPTGISTARASGFSKELLEIFFGLYEEVFAAHDNPPSRIFNVDETSSKENKNPGTQRQTSDWRFNCGGKELFNNNCCIHEC
jgi:hypothetical protein